MQSAHIPTPTEQIWLLAENLWPDETDSWQHHTNKYILGMALIRSLQVALFSGSGHGGTSIFSHLLCAVDGAEWELPYL
jgi:hypothetical protein